jgi:hypothetical protein
MWRSLGTLLALFVLSTSLLAQESKPPSSVSASSVDATILRLLDESHDLGRQLPVPVRLMNLLPRQAELVSQLRPDLGREWASELYSLSSQAKGPQRTSVQNAAIGMLIRLDPDSGRALELLHSLNIQEPVPNWAPTPPEMQLVNEIFQVLIKRDGASALAVLEREAERLGTQGHYPYAALGYAAMEATLKDWGSDTPHAIQVLQSVFEPAFRRYNQNAHSYSDDFEFGRMLQTLSGGMPFDSLEPAVRMLVKNLLRTDTRRYEFELDGYTAAGKAVKVHNAIDAAIVLFGTLLSRDPELLGQLARTRPELQTALEYTKGEPMRSMSFHFPWPSSPKSEQQKTHTETVNLSLVNPEAAIAEAERLPDDQRASTMLDLARNIAGDYTERAAELIAEAQLGNRPANDESSVNVISAEAFVAVAQNRKDELHELLQHGFESANRVIVEQQRTGGIHFFTGLGPLVQVGIENDPDLTIAFLESLAPSYLKAELLLGAAWDLSRPAHVPIRPRPQPEGYNRGLHSNVR